MTPEQTLDWLADQHQIQSGEDRPIQHWICSMKSMLPLESLRLAVGLNDADFAIYQRGYDKGHAEGAVAGKKPNIPDLQPPQHTWIDLTDEEIKAIVGPWGSTEIKGYTRKLFDQIEAALKEKNT